MCVVTMLCLLSLVFWGKNVKKNPLVMILSVCLFAAFMTAPMILGLRFRIAGHGDLTTVCQNLREGKAVPLQCLRQGPAL